MGLHVRGLVKSYSERRVVDEVELDLKRGEIVGLLGPNGAGKTTTFHMITGFIRPEAGSIEIDGRDITGMPVYRRARLGLGYLSQEPSIFRKLTVYENVLAILEMLPARKAGSRAHRPGNFQDSGPNSKPDSLETPEGSYRRSGPALAARARELLDRFNVGQLAAQKGQTLSGGERRRVEIARALAAEPAYLLLDEPFTGIDPIVRAEIQDIVRGLRDDGLGVLITDHNVRETLEITDRAYIMYDARVLLSGTSEDLVRDVRARQFYLGEKFRI